MPAILIVDDETPIREWLSSVIRQNRPHIAVDTAVNGADALKKLQEKRFDLVISDIRMPQKTGLELFESMQTLCPDTGIIVLSSYDDFSYVRSAFKLAALDYLLKAEIDEARLLFSVDNYFAGKAGSGSRGLQKLLGEYLAGGAPSFALEKELSTQSVQLPSAPYFIFLLERGAATPRSIFLPTSGCVRILFFTPLNDALSIGCAECPGCAGRLEQLQTLTSFCSELNTYNSPRLCVCSEMQSAADGFGRALRHTYACRTLGFYGASSYLLKPQAGIPGGEWYARALQAAKLRDAAAIRACADGMFQAWREALYPDLGRIQGMSLKVLESAYLSFHGDSADAFVSFLEGAQTKITEIATHAGLLAYVQESLEDICTRRFPAPPVSGRIKGALDYIGQNYMHPITLDTVARVIHVNPEYLSRSFKKEAGINFNSYLNDVRLKKALDLIRDTDLRICEISLETGYQNFSYFSKCFKKKYGVSPQELRANRTLPLRVAQPPPFRTVNGFAATSSSSETTCKG